VENHSHAEQIANRLVLCLEVFEIDHLRSHVTWSSAPNEHIRVILAMLCKPKICNYAVVIVVFSQENVLGFKVSVHHSVAVHNFQTLQNTLHDHFNLRGCELVSHLYLVVKLSAL
jgi:hypothetical protein